MKKKLQILIYKKMIWVALLISFTNINSQGNNSEGKILLKANQNNQQQDLVFTENKGQVMDAEGKKRPDIFFTAHSGNTHLFLSKNGIHYQFIKNIFSKNEKKEKLVNEKEISEIEKTETYHFSVELLNANPNAKIIKEEKTTYTENFYNTVAPEGITNVGTYKKVVYKNVYTNIDWVIYSNGQHIKYDFIVHPGGDASLIKLNVKDVIKISLNKKGDLVIKTDLGKVVEEAPVSFVDGKTIKSNFILKGNTISYALENYDKTKTLTIDPSVSWATYYGGSGNDFGRSCAVSDSGFVYLAGYTSSTSTISSGGFQNSHGGGVNDAFLVKFSPSGSRLWATYYGGSSGVDYGYTCAVSDSGFVYLAGQTSSSSGIASGGYQNTYGGGTDAFLVKFNPSGGRLWSTYFGGTDIEYVFSCAVSDSGFVYLSGNTRSSSGIASGGFQNTYGGGTDAFLVKFNPSGGLLWSTYYGSPNFESVYSCAVSDSGFVYIAGNTTSTSGISSGGFQNTYGGGNYDAYLVKFNPSGGRLWATYYGGNNQDISTSCVISDSGFVYLVGETQSTSGIASGGFQNTIGGGVDAFLVKFNPSGGRVWATYYGGSSNDYGYSCAVNTKGFVYLVGYTPSSTGIAFAGIQNTYGTGGDAFLVKFKPNGGRFWGTYYGGSNSDYGRSCAVSDSGFVYVAGYTRSTTGISSGGFQNAHGGGNEDAFLIKINDVTYNWNGSIDEDWETAANWTPALVPNSTTDVNIPSSLSNYPVLTSGTNASCNNIFIQSGASVTVDGGLLQIIGNYIYNDGIFTNPSGIIEMKGIEKQYIYTGNFTDNQVNSLIINNANGVELANQLKVGGVLKRNSGLFITQDSLVLSAKSVTSYGQIDPVGSDLIFGKAKVEKVMSDSNTGWRHLSIPVDATINSLSGIDVLTSSHSPAGQRNIYRWDTTNAGNGIAVGYIEASNSDDEKYAYAIYSNNANVGLHHIDTLISIFGTPNKGNYTVNLSNNYDPLGSQTSTSQGWSMIPNRYPSNIDVSALVYDANFQPAYKAVHVWDFINQQYVGINGSGLINYSTKGGGIGTGNDITPFQAFWVKSDASGQSIVIKDIHRTTSMDSVTIFQKSGTSFLRLTIEDKDGYKDQIAVGFDPIATEGLDGTMDIFKIKSMSEDVPTLSIQEKDMDLSVDVLPTYKDRTVQLMLSSQKENHNYTFSPDLTNLDLETEVFLVDKKTGNVSDLKNGDVQITYSKADATDRYFLRFAKSSANLQNINSLQKTYASTDEEGIKVWYLNADNSNVDIEIYNIQGQLVFSQNQLKSGENIKFDTNKAAKQMYLINVKNNNDIKTLKVIY